MAVPSPARLADEYAAAGARLHIVPMRRITTTEGAAYWARYATDWPVSVLRLAALARRIGADVVHTNSLHSWYGWAVARLLGRPHVWHAREIVVQSAAALRVERFLARRFADRLIAMSGAIAAQLDHPHLDVVVDDPDPTEWSPSLAGRFRRRAGIPDDAPLIGSAARIDTWKGFDVLVDAVPLIHAARPDARLVVAGAPVGGKDHYAADLARRAAALPGVDWLGPRRDLPELMADLDVFVQVSTQPEPFGLVHVEALASGVPIVAGDQGGPVEILAGALEGAGRLVRGGDPAALASAVVELLDLAVPGADARRRRPRLRPSSTGRYGAIFDEAIEARAGATPGRRLTLPSADPAAG